MCHIIDSYLILVNILKNKKNECTIKDLLQMKDELEKSIPNIFIDITRQSIFSTLEYYPNMFYWTGNSIKCKNNSESLFNETYIESNFNRKLPDNIKEKFLNIVNA